ncbi:MAG: hypothetical protein ACLP56_08195 [Candidatus Sulfotelmatobacter sp.]
MLKPRPVLHAVLFALLLPLFTAAHVSLAYGQSFSIVPSPLSPPAGVNPGNVATSVIDLTATGGFDSPVSLSCVATSTQFTSNLPVCTVSPASAVPPADGPGITITTSPDTAAGQYTITVTGTSGSETETATLYLNVQDIPQDYTLTVSKPISPSAVLAGYGAQATVTVTPIGSYSDANPPNQVTLSCLSVTPTVVGPPFCSFAPATVTVSNGIAPTSVLTVSTYGSAIQTTENSTRRIFYGFGFALPALALLGAGTKGSLRKRLLGLLLLLAVAGGLLLLPSCGSSTRLNNSGGLVTPKNTYTITLTAVDQNGIAPSNTSTTTGAATVSLTVNAD